jgi:hypothetical protein
MEYLNEEVRQGMPCTGHSAAAGNPAHKAPSSSLIR